MTYQTFINKLRVSLKDFSVLGRDSIDGDGSTTLFELTTRPIKDGSYTIKVGGVEKTETTDYTMDKDLGLITFTTAPAAGTDNIVVTFRSVKIKDEDYIDLINDAIDHFRWKFWKMDIDTTTLTTVKDQYEYDCSGITNLLYVVRLYYKTTSQTVWTEVQALTNYKYYTRLDKLFVDPTFSTTGLMLKMIYLKSFSKETATSDDLDIPDEFLLPYKYYIFARYYEQLIPEKIHDVSAITTQPSFTPAQAIYNIAEMYYKKADDIANKLGPRFPNMPIKNLTEGVVL